METMRWILLGIGAVFLLVIYLSGRNKNKQQIDATDLESEDIPDFSAKQFEDIDENISDVHISAREINDIYMEQQEGGDDFVGDEFDDMAEGHLTDVDSENMPEELPSDEQVSTEDEIKKPSDLIVINIISRNAEMLHGDMINSALLANKLKFGAMSIYHRMGTDAKPLFSVANMVEPGSFDPETMHDLRTPGLTFFMQLPVFGSNSAALTDMLQSAYQVAEILNSDLCDQSRKPLSEIQAEKYRDLAKQYDSE